MGFLISDIHVYSGEREKRELHLKAYVLIDKLLYTLCLNW